MRRAASSLDELHREVVLWQRLHAAEAVRLPALGARHRAPVALGPGRRRGIPAAPQAALAERVACSTAGAKVSVTCGEAA